MTHDESIDGDGTVSRRDFYETMLDCDECRERANRTEHALSELLDYLARELEKAGAERDRYHDALIARHGGEPIALLSELDEARAERDALRKELQNIANADPRSWQNDVQDQFQEWAQSRARAALAALAEEKP